MSVGHLNWSGREKTIVEMYEQISKAFCHAASTEGKTPLLSASISCRYVNIVIYFKVKFAANGNQKAGRI